ncbi:hypothetical protein ACODT4_15435 [Streptomyces sp. 2.9]
MVEVGDGQAERLQRVHGLVHEMFLLLNRQGRWRGVRVQPRAVGEPP